MYGTQYKRFVGGAGQMQITANGLWTTLWQKVEKRHSGLGAKAAGSHVRER